MVRSSLMESIPTLPAPGPVQICYVAARQLPSQACLPNLQQSGRDPQDTGVRVQAPPPTPLLLNPWNQPAQVSWLKQTNKKLAFNPSVDTFPRQSPFSKQIGSHMALFTQTRTQAAPEKIPASAGPLISHLSFWKFLYRTSRE